MRKVVFLFTALVLLACSTLWAATPFTESSVKIEGRGDPGGSANTGVVNLTGAQRLNVRTAPGDAIVGQLKPGDKVKIISTSGDWYKIEFFGETRYVSKEFIKTASAEPAKPPTEKKQPPAAAPVKSWTGKVQTNGATLNVRTGPWGTIIGSLADNATVKVIGQTGDWYKIDYQGKTRYVHKDYIANANAPRQTTRTAYVNTGGATLNVRSGAWGAIVGSLSNGAQVTIVGESGDWYKISHGGQTRYVHKDYIANKKPSVAAPPSSGSSGATYKASVIGKTQGDGTVAGAITWARDQINGTKNGVNSNNGLNSKNIRSWDGWCLAFVGTAYGRSKSVLAAPSAIQAYYNCKRAGKIVVNKNPPAGAVLFTGTTSTNPYGHIFIATGKMNGPNDPIIITTSSNGIKEMPMSQMWKGPAYLGWALP